ncbi:MAG: hypothetical protein H7A51_15905 [Akkermansiaceae bacterium]|nr:hypothetical protein [Akkermansiaceae bacterium]
MKLKKYIQIGAVLISAPLILASCGEKKADENTGTATTENTEVKPYPLDTCIVSGEELGSMGEPHVFVHEGQEIKMFCDKCVPKFDKNPAKYLALLKKGKTSTDGHDHTDHSGHNH